MSLADTSLTFAECQLRRFSYGLARDHTDTRQPRFWWTKSQWVRVFEGVVYTIGVTIALLLWVYYIPNYATNRDGAPHPWGIIIILCIARWLLISAVMVVACTGCCMIEDDYVQHRRYSDALAQLERDIAHDSSWSHVKWLYQQICSAPAGGNVFLSYSHSVSSGIILDTLHLDIKGVQTVVQNTVHAVTAQRVLIKTSWVHTAKPEVVVVDTAPPFLADADGTRITSH